MKFSASLTFSPFNDTFVHVTDLSGKETLCRVTWGMKVKADRDESSPYAAMLAAQDVADKCKALGVTALHIKIRGTEEIRHAAQDQEARVHSELLLEMESRLDVLKMLPQSQVTPPVESLEDVVAVFKHWDWLLWEISFHVTNLINKKINFL